jgi:hypothetical protein
MSIQSKKKQDNEKRLTSINEKVSNLIHNQRTTLLHQNITKGALLNHSNPVITLFCNIYNKKGR